MNILDKYIVPIYRFKWVAATLLPTVYTINDVKIISYIISKQCEDGHEIMDKVRLALINNSHLTDQEINKQMKLDLK